MYARPEVIVLLLRIQCGFCEQFFHLCRRCYRGHVYCCDFCRIHGKRHKRNQAQKRYRQTEKGQKNHCKAENRRRQRRNGKGFEKKMDDASSTLGLKWIILFLVAIQMFVFERKSGFWKPRCRFCGISGRIVRQFPRRKYGKIQPKQKRRKS